MIYQPSSTHFVSIVFEIYVLVVSCLLCVSVVLNIINIAPTPGELPGGMHIVCLNAIFIVYLVYSQIVK